MATQEGLTRPISIRFDPAQLGHVDKVLQKENRGRAGHKLSQSEMIRILIQEALDTRTARASGK